MQSLQQPQLLSKQGSPQFDFGDSNHQSVSDFLNHCHLNQYLDIFLSEGFDSVTSLLEITEEDMIFMNVKRGHRRLIQREVATAKGIPRDQPLITNMMGAKYPTDVINSPIKIPMNNNNNISFSNNNSNSTMMKMNSGASLSGSYDPIPTGLTSPRSMNSGIGSGSSGNSSSGPITTLRSRFQQQNPRLTSSSTNDSANSSTDSNPSTNTNNVNNNSNSNTNNGGGNQPTLMSDNRSSSVSSNDDNDSIDTNESVPTKRKYRRHAKPDRHAPIKPPSAYIMFSNDARAELKNQNLSFAELAKIVGDQWKNLSHIEKQAYERMAMRAKDEYLAALEQYRQTPQYSRYQEYLNDFKSKQDAANRLIGRARKRAKQTSPGSGSIADSSSNGNSNGSGSSGSGSADAYGDKDSVIRRQRRPSELDSPENQQQAQKNYDYDMDKNINDSNQLRPIHHHHHHRPSQQQSSDSGYTSQTYYNVNNDKPNQPQWSYRSNQIMRGMLPVEFVHSTPSEQTQQQKNSMSVSKDLKRSPDVGDEEDEVEEDEPNYSKRRSPRFTKPNNTM